MNITGHFPRILWLKNPVIGYSQKLAGIIRVMERDSQSVDGPIHSFEYPMKDIEPAPGRLYGSCSRTNFHFVPVILHGFDNYAGVTPVDKIGRIGNPYGPG
jgi:hypothetical protein